MTKVTCNKCGKELDPHNNHIRPLPNVAFTIEVFKDGGPNNTQIRTEYPFETLQEPLRNGGIPFKCQFSTTDIAFCEDCILAAFYKGVQDEFLKRQKAAEEVRFPGVQHINSHV